MKILFLVQRVLSEVISGYTIRTHEIAKQLCKNNDIIVVSRLNSTIVDKTCIIDGVKYYSLISKFKITQGLDCIYTNNYILTYEKELRKLLNNIDFSPDVIHAHSNYGNGLVAYSLAKKLNAKFIYEMRGFWEMSRQSHDKEFINSNLYNQYHNKELSVCMNADKIVVLTEQMKNKLIEYELNPEKIHVVENGVDTNVFSNTYEYTKKHFYEDYGVDLYNYVVIGYFGSLCSYEGLDLLIKTMSVIQVQNVKLLIFGDATNKDSTKNKKKLYNLANILKLDNVHFMGKVNHKKVSSLYNIVDIVCLPRKGEEVCNIVCPLKPFEVMSMGKALLLSDVDVFKDLSQKCESVILFEKDNVNSLTQNLIYLLEDNDLRDKLGGSNRLYVENNHKWANIVDRYSDIYE